MNSNLVLSSNSYNGYLEGVITLLFDMSINDKDLNIEKCDDIIINDDARRVIQEIGTRISLFWAEVGMNVPLRDKEKKLNISEIFPNCRDFTEEEAKLYRQSLNNLYKPSGKKLFNL